MGPLPRWFAGVDGKGPEKRIDQALEEFRTALSLDPLSRIVNVNYGVTLTIAGRYPEALAQYNKIIESEPNFGPPHYYLSQLYAMTGRYGDAIREFPKPAGPSASWSPDAQGYSRLVATRSNDVKAPAVLALSFALAGDRDKAFAYFEKAYQIEDGDLIQTLRYPALDPIRSDPRYRDLMRRLNLPE